LLLHDSRRATRLNAEGDLVLLEDQDRTLWNRDQIEEALPLVEEALRSRPGPLAIQAAIAAVHCQARRQEETDWRQILELYGVLERIQPSPIVTLNRAVALAMVEGPERALELIDEITKDGALENYHLFHATKADMLRRAGSLREASNAYARALELVTNDSERRFLQRRLQQVENSSDFSA
jgi:RNA polymerase sigma-70 factor (ECF subfamily)